MELRHLGYACTNVSIPSTTGRTLRLANLTPERVREVIAENLANVSTILKWNADHGIGFFRVSSDVIPFASHAKFDLDWRAEFADELAHIRAFVADQNMRLSMHPGQYTVLNSPRVEVVTNALAELDYHAAFIEAVDPCAGTVTLHVGGAYGDKRAAIDRFRSHFDRLSPRAQERLILENDDTTYSADEVVDLCQEMAVPMVFDYLHHKCNPPASRSHSDDLALIEQVVATWGGRLPKFHISSLREGTRASHAEIVTVEDFDEFMRLMHRVDGDGFDLMLEAKRKDKAVLWLQSHARRVQRRP